MTVAERVDYRRYITSIATSHDNGTGFFVGPDLLCTCYHVVKDCDVSDITIRWQDKDIHIEDCSCYENLDLVFIKTRDAGNMGWLPFNPSQTIVEGMTFQSFGYPIDHETNGSPLLLTYSGADKINKILTFSQDNVTPGYSGSPIVTSESNRLVGMLGISRDISTPSGGRGLSANYILETLCKDRKYYKDALAMIRSNDFFSTEDCQWAVDNPYLTEAVLKYLRIVLRRNPEYHLFSVLRPFLRLTFDGEIPDNPYIATAKFFIEEHKDLCEVYIKWLNQHKNSKDREYIESAIIFLQDGIIPLPQEAIACTESFCNKLKSARISGSSHMKVTDLFSRNGKLKVPFNWHSANLPVHKNSLEKNVITELENGCNCLILANPGVGKSTLAKALLFELISLRVKNKTRILPVYVDLHQELIYRERTFGDEWLFRKISQQYGGLSSFYLGSMHANIVLILDGLDEYLDGLSRYEIESFFSTELFDYGNKHKVIITCREQFYRRRLDGFYNVLESFRQMNILPWKEEQKVKYIKQYIKLLKRKKYATSDTNEQLVLQQIVDSPFLREVSGTPLYLNMTIEVLSSGCQQPIIGIVDLYDQYSYNWLHNEMKRSPQFEFSEELFRGDLNIMMGVISAISWKYYEFTLINRFTNSPISSFSYKEIADFLHVVSNDLKLPSSDIEFCNKLAKYIVGHTFFVSGQSLNLRFIHKSFYEYFSARFIFEMLTKKQPNPSLIIKLHSILLSPEVSELIKEHIARINSVPYLQHCFLDNCIHSLAYLSNNYNEIALSTPTRRIVRQQIIYHIGLIEHKRSSSYLKSILVQETDLWIKRGIIIGLSFSGDSSELDNYINRMRKELTEEPPWEENDINIGFSLSFFGDQPYDNYAPEIDQQLPKCRNTVERLVYQLSTNVDRPSWRSNLYTLVYLAHYRPVSEKEYSTVIRSKKDQLSDILDRISNTKNINWPEVKELRTILDNINEREISQ